MWYSNHRTKVHVIPTLLIIQVTSEKPIAFSEPQFSLKTFYMGTKRVKRDGQGQMLMFVLLTTWNYSEVGITKAEVLCMV